MSINMQFSVFLTILWSCFLYLLKTVEIVIIPTSGGILSKMRQRVLKALANPARIFYVPYNMAILNFAVQFLVFIAVFVASLLWTGGKNPVSPLWFLVSLCVVHMIMATFSKRDPQLGQILAAKIQLFKKKIPNRLAA